MDGGAGNGESGTVDRNVHQSRDIMSLVNTSVRRIKKLTKPETGGKPINWPMGEGPS